MDANYVVLFGAFLSILMINIVLSGDNAVVIALASRSLPASQQKKAVFYGTFGAIALRVLLTLVVVYLLKIPFLKFVGGVMLVWIAIKLLSHEEDDENVEGAANIWAAIKTIIVADFVMSLDNVLGVAAAAQGHMGLLIAGLAISIPIIIAGSSIILKLMDKWPFVVDIGAALIGWTAGEMIMEDELIKGFIHNDIATYAISLVLAVGVVVIGRYLASHPKERKTDSI
ncbi:MAG TPA: TerC family protein [Bacillota bacterium]|nr:TerC family protein [Bacillota bacterium]